MAKNSQYTNTQAVSSKWSGKCDACGAWNAATEEPLATARPARARPPKDARSNCLHCLGETRTGAADFLYRRTDRVLGGLVAGPADDCWAVTPALAIHIAVTGRGKKRRAKSCARFMFPAKKPLPNCACGRTSEARPGPGEFAAETNIADIRKTFESAGNVGLVIIDSHPDHVVACH